MFALKAVSESKQARKTDGWGVKMENNQGSVRV